MLPAPSAAHLRVQLANKLALEGSLTIIRGILANKDGPLHAELGMTTAELHQLTLEHLPPTGFFNPHLRDNRPFPPIPPPRIRCKQKVQPPTPPNPEHPVRSKAFLKKKVLQYLVGTQELMKIRVERMLDASMIMRTTNSGNRVPAFPHEVGQKIHTTWVWKAYDPAHPSIVKQHRRLLKPSIAPYGAEVGVGEDLSHLSKKRRSERRAEIRRDLHMLKVREGIMRQKERSEAGAELRRLQAAKKAQQEQEWEDRKMAARDSKAAGAEMRKVQAAKTPRQEQEWEDKRFAARNSKTTTAGGEVGRLQAAKKTRQEQEWEDKRLAARNSKNTTWRKN